jgi:hypothetical protein
MRRGKPRRSALRAGTIELLEGRALLTSASFQVIQDWGGSFQGHVVIRNTDPAPISNWKLEFDDSPAISSIWDARVTSHVGNHYVIVNAGWNATIPANGTVSFGFNASPGHTTTAPANYLLNGVPISGGPNQPPPLTLSIDDASTVEGNSGTKDLPFTVRLSAASASPVTVAYATADRTANAGSDYLGTSGALTFEPGATSKTLTVKIVGDTTVEPDETFAVNLSAPLGAILGRAQATGTIVNDDAPPPPPGGISASVTYQVTSDWGSGFNGQITVRNTSTTSLKNGWTLAFDLPAAISSIWDAAIVSRSGNHYVVKDAVWNASLPAGGTVSFGFTASPGNLTVGATNFVLSGPSGGSTNQPPVAVADSAVVLAGQPATVAVLANDTDPNNDSLTVTSATQGQNGRTAINADGTITYTPNAGFVGNDTFAYTISDGRNGTASAQVTIAVVTAPVTPQRVFNPYVDMTLYPTPDIATVARTQGVKFFTLAFVVAVHGTTQPAWGGYSDYAVNGGAFDQQLRSQVATVRSLGGDVTVSFGGANGTELAQAITDTTALKNAYRSVVDAYALTSVDFDIEGGAVADHASIDRRSQTLAALQRDLAAAGKNLSVWLTLPVLPTGLTNDGLYVVQSAQRYGVQLSGVNVMAMDYGDGAAPNPAGHMGDYAIQSATSTFNQLKGVYGSSRTDAQLWSMVGGTPMIGLNDVTTEVFDQSAARQLLAFAQQRGLGRLAMWSLSRDQPVPGGGSVNYVDTKFSSIIQTPYEFSGIFKVFTS